MTSLTFYNIAKENGRKFVVKINDAYFLKYLSQDKHLDVPNIADEDVIIYLPKRGSGQYQDKDYKGKDRNFWFCIIAGLQNKLLQGQTRSCVL